MRTFCPTRTFAITAMLLLTAGVLIAAEEPEAADAELDSTPVPVAEGPFDNLAPAPYSPWLATRFGWWGLHTSGSKSGVGEWQGLDESSPFFDVDGIMSDGVQTLDFFATGVENESTLGDLYFYGGPGLSLDVNYDRFLHRLGHEPIGGLPIAGGFPPPGGLFNPPLPDGDPAYVMFGEDLNVGQDYAIRVQQLKAKFKGQLTNNVRWRLNVWGLKKEGTRQANSHQHCFTNTPAPGGRTCHVLSQGQRIDWLTMEVEPVIEARFDWVTLEYSRTMRSFQQSDEMVFNDFTSFNTTYGLGGEGAYAFVPENVTAIDRLKLHGQLGPFTEMYVVGNVGNTHNKFRESDRKFYGVDARLMNTSFEGLSLTVYGKTFSQNNSADTVALNDRYPSQADWWREDVPPQDFYNPTSTYLGLVDRTFVRAGIKSRYRPFVDSPGLARRLAFTSGYEYAETSRNNVTYDLEDLDPPIMFTQPTTVTNSFFVGLQQDWTWTMRSFLRYRMIENNWPLVGITHREQASLDAAINSNQPEHLDRIELGGTWTPTDNFMANASFWIENAYNHSNVVNFDEDNYPIVLSAWYAPDPCWSFSGGFATFSNWIDQDVTFGREDGGSPGELAAWTSPWNYRGRADVLNLGTTYSVSPRVRLTAGFEHARTGNWFNTPPAPAGAIPYTDLPGYSQVRVTTYRVLAGLDYELTQNCNTFLRYNYYDFDDKAMAFNAGEAHMFLGGFSGVY